MSEVPLYMQAMSSQIIFAVVMSAKNGCLQTLNLTSAEKALGVRA
jgi:hypothetical protein